MTSNRAAGRPRPRLGARAGSSSPRSSWPCWARSASWAHEPPSATPNTDNPGNQLNAGAIDLVDNDARHVHAVPSRQRLSRETRSAAVSTLSYTVALDSTVSPLTSTPIDASGPDARHDRGRRHPGIDLLPGLHGLRRVRAGRRPRRVPDDPSEREQRTGLQPKRRLPVDRRGSRSSYRVTLSLQTASTRPRARTSPAAHTYTWQAERRLAPRGAARLALPRAAPCPASLRTPTEPRRTAHPHTAAPRRPPRRRHLVTQSVLSPRTNPGASPEARRARGTTGSAQPPCHGAGRPAPPRRCAWRSAWSCSPPPRSVAGPGAWAALSGSTDNTGNTFSAGTVTMTDNDAPSAATFTFTNQKPGVSRRRPHSKVNYTGSASCLDGAAATGPSRRQHGSDLPFTLTVTRRGQDSSPSFDKLRRIRPGCRRSYNGLGRGAGSCSRAGCRPSPPRPAFTSGLTDPLTPWTNASSASYRCSVQVVAARATQSRLCSPGKAELPRGRRGADAPAAGQEFPARRSRRGSPTPPEVPAGTRRNREVQSAGFDRRAGRRREPSTAFVAGAAGTDASFAVATGDPGNSFSTIRDWKPPVTSRATVVKAEGGLPGYVRAGGSYTRHRLGDRRPLVQPPAGLAAVRSDVSTLTAGATAVAMPAAASSPSAG